MSTTEVAIGPARFRILAFRYADSLSAARLRGIGHDKHGGRLDVVLDYDELRQTAPGQLSSSQGRILEHIQGEYVPRRVRFVGVSGLECSGLYAHLEDVPLAHGARSLRGILSWQLRGQPSRWAVFNGSTEPAELMLSAQRYHQEPCGRPIEMVDQWRDWAPAPPLPACRIALKKRVHDRYGGDPIPVHVDGKAEPRRLFVGGLNHQPLQRPAVDAVLNLGDEASRWEVGGAIGANDRWARKGEGQVGMTVDELQAEAAWVAGRVSAGQRVLVHCSAGFNRSVTVCCAVLMFMEKLSAEAALSRVRVQHPWARPDSHHWLALRWLAEAR